MRISDWSSDVCSSDLVEPVENRVGVSAPTCATPFGGVGRGQRQILEHSAHRGHQAYVPGQPRRCAPRYVKKRAGERRVGSERVSPYKSRGAPRQSKKNTSVKKAIIAERDA